jgi:predicted ATPase/class 3 adenylate cyclase
MGDAAQWLEHLGLGQYVSAFAESDIDEEILRELKDDDLKELGLTLGHRKKLLKAIAELRSDDPAEAMSADIPGAPNTSFRPEAPEAERRQLTVLFCDMVGSTAMSGRLDPEDMRKVIGAYRNVVAGEVGRFEGHVAKFMGDGVLAYFGYPLAHEDDAERAVRAGLALTDVIRNLGTPIGESLAVRIGIATGLVVVGDLVGTDASEAESVIGETPNLAARLQATAPPNMVVVGAETRGIVGDLFEWEDLGRRALKGFPEPIQAWRALQAKQAETRFEARHGATLAPLVGREEEIDMLLRRWRSARSGEGQVVLLSGEAGVGKSRIAQELRERIADEPQVRVHYQCSPYFTQTALHPFIEQLSWAAGFARIDGPDQRMDKMEAMLRLAMDDIVGIAPLFAALFTIPAGERYPPLELAPAQWKEKTFEAILGQMEGLAERQPMLVIFEDAHWIDPTSLELLDRIVARLQTLPILFIITYRPQFVAPWVGQPHVTLMTLNRMGRRECAAMVEKVAGGKALPDGVLDRVLAQADGVPLFVEELTKAIIESGLMEERAGRYVLTGPLAAFAVPASLQDSLMARLDRMAAVKEVAQMGAAVGREFSYELISAVSAMSETALRDALAKLAKAELVFQRGTPPDATYLFKHALVRDAAYESLLKSRRQELHTRIAAVLEDRFSETLATKPEVLAHHLSQAGLNGKAVGYWRTAGEIAVRRSANIEAITHFLKALESLMTQPEGRDRAATELALQMALAVPIMASKGISDVEVERAYERAQALCEELGELDTLFPILRGLWNCYVARGQFQRALDLAARIAALAEKRKGAVQRALAHRALGTTLFFLGRLTDALDQADRAIAIDDALQGSDSGRAHLFLYGERPGLVSRLYSGWALWFLGFPDRAVERFDAALALAESLAHAHSLAFALAFAAHMRNNRRDFARALEYADAASQISVKHNLPLWLAESTVAKGYAQASLGSHAEGIGLIRSGIASLDRLGDWHHRTHWLGLLGTAHLEAGACDDALAALNEALEVATVTEEGYCSAELDRLKGVVLTRQDEPDEADACFQKALSAAAQSGAKALELRAATSLARLWNNQGRRAEARQVLAPIYGWFTEGFDTKDLEDAKQLLDDLGN